MRLYTDAFKIARSSNAATQFVEKPSRALTWSERVMLFNGKQEIAFLRLLRFTIFEIRPCNTKDNKDVKYCSRIKESRTADFYWSRAIDGFSTVACALLHSKRYADSSSFVRLAKNANLRYICAYSQGAKTPFG